MKLMIASLCLTMACTTEENLGRTTGAPPLEVPAALPTPIDLLVVLDDTTAMASYLPRVPPPANVGVVTAIYNGAPDVRIAVTTSTTGTLRVSPSVPSGVLAHTVSMADGSLQTNYDGSLGAALGTLMNVGTTSTEPNAVLANTERALDASVDLDFLRPGSGVGILLVTAGDDQSPADVAGYASAIQSKGHDVLVSAIYTGTPPRVSTFLDAFAYRYITPLDAYNMDAISVFSWLFHAISRDYCLPLMPGQYDPWGDNEKVVCELSTSYEGAERALPRCNGDPWQSDVPCFTLLLAGSDCTSGRYLQLGGPFQMYHPRIVGACAAR